MRILAIIALVTLLSGCGEERAAPPPGAEAPAASVEAAAFPAESAAVPLLLARSAEEAWSVRELRHLPRYFLASGWAAPDTLWGLAGNTPVFAHVTEPEYRAAGRSYWDAALSADGTLAGIDARGVWIGRGEDARLLLDRAAAGGEEGDLSGPLLWSPDGAYLLARRVREGPPLHLLLDSRTGAFTPLPARADSLQLGDPFWVDAGRILLVGHPSLDPERGPLGRGDLHLYDVAGGNVRRVARAPEGVFLRPLSSWGPEGVLVGESTGAALPVARYRVYDARGRAHRVIDLPAAHRVLAADTARALLVVRREGAREPAHEVSLRRGASVSPLLSVRGRDVRLHWSPDGESIAVGAAGEEIGEDGSVRPYYHTWIVESR